MWCILYSRNIIHSCLDQVTWKNMQTKQATHERFQNAQRKKSNAKVFSPYNGIIQPHTLYCRNFQNVKLRIDFVEI